MKIYKHFEEYELCRHLYRNLVTMKNKEWGMDRWIENKDGILFYIIKGAVFYLTIRRIWIEMLGMIENL